VIGRNGADEIDYWEETDMRIRQFALIIGAIFTVAGIAGFIPGLNQMHYSATEHGLMVETAYGYLFGLFPVNVLHNLVHLGIGIWGLVASRDTLPSRAFSRSLAIIYGLFAVMGLIPGLNNVFGLVPLWGHDIWLHALTAIPAAYFGWVHGESRDRDLGFRRPLST
jgi:hypothetical protein